MTKPRRNPLAYGPAMIELIEAVLEGRTVRIEPDELTKPATVRTRFYNCLEAIDAYALAVGKGQVTELEGWHTRIMALKGALAKATTYKDGEALCIIPRTHSTMEATLRKAVAQAQYAPIPRTEGETILPPAGLVEGEPK